MNPEPRPSTMCEPATMTIPNDPGYVEAVLAFVSAVARELGFAAPEMEEIAAGTRRALAVVFRYAFEPEEPGRVQVACERVPEGLQITIHDKGMPLDWGELLQVAEREGREGSDDDPLRLAGCFDRIRLQNLGRDGKAIRLVKHRKTGRITDFYDACELTPYAQPGRAARRPPLEAAFSIRPMRPGEAVEVARCIYQTYGYTYPDEDVYYPEKLAALNASGQLLSAVALAASGEIAGHCALRFGKLRTGPAEITQGAVKPQFRSMGVMTRLTDYLVKKAASYGLAGIRARPVTHHTHSQRIGHKFGLKDCGICLALIPRTTTFRQMASGSGCRVSTLVQFGHLTAPDRLEVFPPDHHRDMIARLYRHLEVPVRLRLPLQQPALDDHSVFDVQVIDMLSHARIRVTRCGNGIERQVRETLRQLCLERVEVIHLVLYLSDPAAALQVKRFEDLGFFFSGISPLDVDHGYGLVLQYLNNVPLDYDEIQVASPVGRTLLAYVKARDPNRG